MWKDSIRNIVVIFQPNILRIVGFYVRHSATDCSSYTSVKIFQKLQLFMVFQKYVQRFRGISHAHICSAEPPLYPTTAGRMQAVGCRPKLQTGSEFIALSRICSLSWLA